MFLHFPSSVSKLKGKANKHWVSLKSPKAACKRAIIPRTKPCHWELVPYLPWKSNLSSELTEKRKLFKLILNMFPSISNTEIAFELSYSFPLFLHIYMQIIIQISLHWVLYLSLEQLADPWGGCCPDSCAISWGNQLIKETKKMQKLLETDPGLQHCSAPLYAKSRASTRWNKDAGNWVNELLHRWQWCLFLSNPNLGC